MIENRFDVSLIAGLALREKQIQQNYRPVIAVHKWFARRPGTLFRGLLLSEFGPDAPLRQTFYATQKVKGKVVADPFMGGGTPLLEANRIGCDVIGYDINPMAHWIVSEELRSIDISEYRQAAAGLRAKLQKRVGDFYRTSCSLCGSDSAHVKYFIWVKQQECPHCGRSVSLFPGYLLAENRRHPMNVLVCPDCGMLNECEDHHNPGRCRECRVSLRLHGTAKRNTCECSSCSKSFRYPVPESGPPKHRLFAIEYYCSSCRPAHQGRFFKKPDEFDLARISTSESMWNRMRPRFVPNETIPAGDESSRLRRWGYNRYREMFNARQLLGLELSCRAIYEQPNSRIKHALATNLSDLLRYQNMLCRYDTMALKSLDIFSVHGFPVGLVHAESNLLGIPGQGKGMSVGSGGWTNIIEKFVKAKQYCTQPFEVLKHGSKKTVIHLDGEWIGDRNERDPHTRIIDVRCQDSARIDFEPESLDAVLTDPPYFGNVQYAELMDFCYVWLRRLVGGDQPHFQHVTTRRANELTGNETMNRTIEDFVEGLSAVFQKSAAGLKPGAPLAFTYHHNKAQAYVAVAVAILDSGLYCSTTLPCPAEMGASIHINKTSSSILDTVFVCRKISPPGRDKSASRLALSNIFRADVEKLKAAGVKPTAGDLRCIALGHMTRMAIRKLQDSWDKDMSCRERVSAVTEQFRSLGGEDRVRELVSGHNRIPPGPQVAEQVPFPEALAGQFK